MDVGSAEQQTFYVYVVLSGHCVKRAERNVGRSKLSTSLYFELGFKCNIQVLMGKSRGPHTLSSSRL